GQGRPARVGRHQGAGAPARRRHGPGGGRARRARRAQALRPVPGARTMNPSEAADSGPSSLPGRAATPARFHALAWRWHFYAGLYVVPFLLVLALTGLVMVFFTGFQHRLGMAIHVTPQAQSSSVGFQAQTVLEHWPQARL